MRQTVRSFAKINLGLEVVARRADGFHDLRTLFQTIDLHDTLTIRVGPSRGAITVTCSNQSIPTDSRNLAFRAAEAVREALGRSGARAIHIHIDKRIPVEGGLGGGSSNAAAVLTHLPRLLGERIPAARLVAAARRLGADVPFFLTGGLALGSRRGDVVRPLPIRAPRFVVLAFGDGGVSTPEAFSRLGLRHDSNARARVKRGASPILRVLAEARRDTGRIPRSIRNLVNHLEPAACALRPSLKQLRDELVSASQAESGASRLVQMTGSGSTFFALFERQSAARRVASRLRRRGIGARVVRTLSSPETR